MYKLDEKVSFQMLLRAELIMVFTALVSEVCD